MKKLLIMIVVAGFMITNAFATTPAVNIYIKNKTKYPISLGSSSNHNVTSSTWSGDDYNGQDQGRVINPNETDSGSEFKKMYQWNYKDGKETEVSFIGMLLTTQTIRYQHH